MPRTCVSVFQSGFSGVAESSSVASSFDTTEYRQNTYGAPTHYCDPTLSVASPSGAGTIGDPWNLTRAMANAVAGNVVGLFPGVGVDITTTADTQTPALNPVNDGTVNSRIVFVTKYAAVALANVATNALRTELRHSGAPEVGTGGNGCAMIGSNGASYITWDGPFIDMAEAQPKGDSGVIRLQSCTGVHLRNFEIKGTHTDMATNPVIYRPGGPVDSILHNFRCYDFINDGPNATQAALFSDQYADTNVLLEHFDLNNTQRGIFFKGEIGPVRNYGTVRYGIVRNVSIGFMFDFLDAVNHTYLHNCLAYNISMFGIHMKSQTKVTENITVHHNTVAKFNGGGDEQGAMGNEGQGIADGGGNVHWRDNLIDADSGGSDRDMWWYNTTVQTPGTPATMNYNFYYKGGDAPEFQLVTTEHASFSAWQAAIQALGSDSNLEAQSGVLSSNPFVDRTNNDFRISGGHQAKTASSTGGEIGAYGELPAGVTLGPYGSYGF